MRCAPLVGSQSQTLPDERSKDVQRRSSTASVRTRVVSEIGTRSLRTPVSTVLQARWPSHPENVLLVVLQAVQEGPQSLVGEESTKFTKMGRHEHDPLGDTSSLAPAAELRHDLSEEHARTDEGVEGVEVQVGISSQGVSDDVFPERGCANRSAGLARPDARGRR